MMIDNSSLCRSSNMRSATALLTAVMTNNANVLSLAISAPVTALKKGEIRVRKQITYAYQKGKSYLWQAIAFLSRIHYEDAFNCHQNGYKVTESGTINLYQISKSFTKAVKANIKFCTSIKRFLLLVSNQVSTEKGLFLMVRTKKVRTQVRTKNILFLSVAKKEVAKLVATEKVLYKWKPINKSLMLNREVRSKYAPKICFLMRTNLIFRHIRGEFSDTLEKVNYLTGLFSFSRQAFLTHAEKLLFSALTIASICSSKSSSKRTLFIVLLGRSYLFFSFFSCIGCYHYSNINLIGRHHFKQSYHKKQSPEVLEALSRDLTQPLIEVMIMANRYDSAHLRARQSKLYKFYNTLTAQVVQTIATTERQARYNLGKQSLIFIARKPLDPTFELSINWGGYSHA